MDYPLREAQIRHTYYLEELAALDCKDATNRSKCFKGEKGRNDSKYDIEGVFRGLRSLFQDRVHKEFSKVLGSCVDYNN